jgi:hypothetical protein
MRQGSCVVSSIGSRWQSRSRSHARKSQENEKGEDKKHRQENCQENSQESGGKKVSRTEGIQKEQGRGIRRQSYEQTFQQASFEITGCEDGVED